jgi:CheY-like chemotaxis protein
LIAQLAVQHKVPVAPEVHPVVLAALNEPLALEELRRVAAVPVVQEGRVSGLVVVDPELAQSLRETLKIDAYYLGSWYDVARALDASEEQTREYERSRELLASQKEYELASSLIKVMCEDVQGYGASAFVIGVQAGRGEYSFETSGGAAAKGAIDSKVIGLIVSYLEAVASGKRTETSGISAVERIGEGTYLVHLGSILVPVYEEAVVSGATPQESPAPLSSRAAKTTTGSNVVAFPERAKKDEGVVLVVEDSPTFGAVVCRFLERQGLRALRCPDGAEALKLLKEGAVRPQLIICDVHMPQLGGEQFVQRVQELFSETSCPPFISVSSDSEVETELAMLRAGVDVFLSKAVDPRVLCAYVEKLLGRSAARSREAVAW